MVGENEKEPPFNAMKISNESFNKLLACVTLVLALCSCSDGGSDGGGTTSRAQTGLSISGTVSGTRIVAVNASDQIIEQDDTAGRTPNGQGQYAWSLGNLPIGNDIRLFFITGGNVYPMYFGTPSTNVFAVNAAGSIGLGHVTTAGNQATPEMSPTDVTLGPPNPDMPQSVAPILTVSSPVNNATLPNGPVTVTFIAQNFTIGTTNQPHLHFYLDSDPVPYHYYSGAPGQVIYQGTAAANVQWHSNTQIKLFALATGTHEMRLVLANAADADLTNTDATKTIAFSVGAPAGNVPAVTITAPSQSASVPVGPITVSFTTQFFTIGTPGQNHLHFYVDEDPVVYEFYDGPAIGEDGSTSGVRYQGIHTHFVHWKSGSSIQINALASGSHQVRFVLVDHAENELASTTKTLNFSVSQPPPGDLQLQSVLTSLNLPVGLALAPDGRVFFNELRTGAIRIINPQWQLVNQPFCNIAVETTGNQGLLGLTLHPNFSNNHYVYVYHTAGSPVRNRVVRYTESSGRCTQETPILDGIPANFHHNSGMIQFGPDGKLYVSTGDGDDAATSQNLTSLAGKILRVNPDGNTPSDNPFISHADATAKKVFSLGHRNSFGFGFHGHTGHLWQTENGPEVNDEINRIVAGGNYGWPTVTGIANNSSFRDPILVYTPPVAPTGIIAIPENSTVYPVAYRNNLLFADFNGGKIRRVVLTGADLTRLGTSSVAYDGGQGGLLSLMLGADGFVYVSNTSAIFKVVP